MLSCTGFLLQGINAYSMTRVRTWERLTNWIPIFAYEFQGGVKIHIAQSAINTASDTWISLSGDEPWTKLFINMYLCHAHKGETCQISLIRSKTFCLAISVAQFTLCQNVCVVLDTWNLANRIQFSRFRSYLSFSMQPLKGGNRRICGILFLFQITTWTPVEVCIWETSRKTT